MKRILIMTAFFSGILMGCTENKQSKSEDNMQKPRTDTGVGQGIPKK